MTTLLHFLPGRLGLFLNLLAFLFLGGVPVGFELLPALSLLCLDFRWCVLAISFAFLGR